MNNLILMDFSQQRNLSPFNFENSFINSKYPKLEILNLSYFGRRDIPPDLTIWRRRLVQLRMLDLSFNNITQFNLRGMSTSRSSSGLSNLTHNNIQTVSEKEIGSFLRVKNVLIDIRYNPFRCNCSLLNFTTFLHKYKTPEAANLDMNYIYLWKLTEDLCSQVISFYTVIILVLSATVVLLLAFIFCITRYREEIRILAFTRLDILLPCHMGETNKECKQFDAFVAYSYLDTEWVVQTLLPWLESPSSGPHFRLCLHQRDFAVGAAIADNIIESIESSRHTVMVLSRNFLESEWCMMEFRTAFHQSLLQKSNHLIPVMLDSVPVEEMGTDLRRCLKTVTYIKVKDRMFWDRLVYALTDKIKGQWKTAMSNGCQTVV
ncbi:LOW QUALITY PROTEIN: protein toll-like [Gigantopelta aegis]|uniref:LOW QUALITY PROTEIN: protein toll-like n=1 Tax=Gigantopelta aegis TaxID=1735272 RepID=UPI001B888D0D|nr:LOW QUALITY PROTEIN: protein toll-like [Gigantopelta aegis]